MKSVLYISILLLLLYSPIVTAQRIHQYNINQYNGLPSNHVYYSLVDRLGYLWMATTNGVVRYNGYQFKTFGLADGIPHDDIWHLYEDRKGRIWLSAITSEMGYIYNDKYKKAWMNNVEQTIYPFVIKENNEGVVFYNNSKKSSIYFEKNDSITSYDVNISSLPIGSPNTVASINNNGEVYVCKNKRVYKYDRKHPESPLVEICSDTSSYVFEDSINRTFYAVNNYIITSHAQKGKFYFLNLENCTRKTITLFTNSSERFIASYERRGLIYMVTNRKLYVLNRQIENIATYYDNKLVANLDSTQYVLNFISDSLWGNCMSVPEKGIYLNMDEDHFFKDTSINLQGYVYIGKSHFLHQYWWNETKKLLLSIDANSKIKTSVLNNVSDLVKIVPYNGEKSLLITRRQLYYINTCTMGVVSFFKNTKHFICENASNLSAERMKLIITDGGVYADAGIINHNRFYITGSIGSRFLDTYGDTVYSFVISSNRGLGYAYDSVNSTIWNYSNSTITIYYVNTGKVIHVPYSILLSIGINKIEKLLIDAKRGNVFIKSHNKLVLYNYTNNTFKPILQNYTLDNTTPYLYDDKLILAGKPGVIFCNINGKGTISKPIFYSNTKNINYQYLYGDEVQLSSNSILINTDNGVYKITIPESNAASDSVTHTFMYNVILYYADTVKRIFTGDSIYIKRGKYSLKFDIINPAGSGIVKYSYYIKGVDNSWKTLNANELHIEGLQPDRYYELYLRASDNAWSSGNIKLILFINPEWWQTYYGKRILGLVLILLFLLLIWGTSILTKRIVTRNNIKKQLELELKNVQLAMELKSIYAQINPHFIFNTLNTGLLFIKKGRIKEAYSHIAAFSGLLRAYIKSSRSKFIPLQEEIENLKNYIVLQEARFKNRFNFEIITHNNINVEETKIPSMLLQPIVENALSHGIFHKEETGNLRLEFKKGKENNELLCIVDDDGIGREKAKIIKENAAFKTQSYGTELIKDLIDIFNKYEPVNINIEYIDKQPPLEGTTVILTIKYL